MGFADLNVNVPYATMATANKIRAWAKRNGATVRLSRYARDAYEGYVAVHSGPLDPFEATAAKAAELKALLHQLGCMK